MSRARIIFLFTFSIVALFLTWFQHDCINLQEETLQNVALEIQNQKIKFEKIEEINRKVEQSSTAGLQPFTHNYFINTTRKTLIEQVIQTDAEKNTVKYVLIWTLANHDALKYLGNGQNIFNKKNCKVKNCFITTNKQYFKDITQFDVLLFYGPHIVNKRYPKLPQKRLPNQTYVFASIESSDYYPICDNKFDGYFNTSWTYKLNSDIFYGYIVTRNKEGKVIGPKKEMHWMNIEEMKPINDTIKMKLSSKKKLAAWLVSNCNAPSGRDNFVRGVQRKLKKMGSSMTVDVYGKCGTLPCNKTDECLNILEKEYYFYFSFENSFAEDYVTEKLLHPLQHYIVPVVFGTANYTRFLPDGIYLNAKELGPDVLAEKMVEIANNKKMYYKYFRWINHYSFHYVEESPETDVHCKFCEAMNFDNLMKSTKVIQNFKKWWNPPQIRKAVPCPPVYLY